MAEEDIRLANDAHGNLGLVFSKAMTLMRALTGRKHGFNCEEVSRHQSAFIHCADMWRKVPGSISVEGLEEELVEEELDFWVKSKPNKPFDGFNDNDQEYASGKLCMYKGEYGFAYADYIELCDNILDDEKCCYLTGEDINDVENCNDGERYFVSMNKLLHLNQSPYEKVQVKAITFLRPQGNIAMFTTAQKGKKNIRKNLAFFPKAASTQAQVSTKNQNKAPVKAAKEKAAAAVKKGNNSRTSKNLRDDSEEEEEEEVKNNKKNAKAAGKKGSKASSKDTEEQPVHPSTPIIAYKLVVDNNNTEGIRRVREGEMTHPQKLQLDPREEEEREQREIEEAREKNKSPEISTRATRTRPARLVSESAAASNKKGGLHNDIMNSKHLSPSKASPVATKRGGSISRSGKPKEWSLAKTLSDNKRSKSKLAAKGAKEGFQPTLGTLGGDWLEEDDSDRSEEKDSGGKTQSIKKFGKNKMYINSPDQTSALLSDITAIADHVPEAGSPAMSVVSTANYTKKIQKGQKSKSKGKSSQKSMDVDLIEIDEDEDEEDQSKKSSSAGVGGMDVSHAQCPWPTSMSLPATPESFAPSLVSSIGALSPPPEDEHDEHVRFMLEEGPEYGYSDAIVWKYLTKRVGWKNCYTAHSKDETVRVPHWSKDLASMRDNGSFDVNGVYGETVDGLDYFKDVPDVITYVRKYGLIRSALVGTGEKEGKGNNNNKKEPTRREILQAEKIEEAKHNVKLEKQIELREKADLVEETRLKKIAKLERAALKAEKDRLKEEKEEERVRLETEMATPEGVAAITPLSPPNDPAELIQWMFNNQGHEDGCYESRSEKFMFNRVWDFLKKDFKWKNLYVAKPSGPRTQLEQLTNMGMDFVNSKPTAFVPPWSMQYINDKGTKLEVFSSLKKSNGGMLEEGVDFFHTAMNTNLMNYIRAFGSCYVGEDALEQLSALMSKSKAEKSDMEMGSGSADSDNDEDEDKDKGEVAVAWWRTHEDKGHQYHPLNFRGSAGMALKAAAPSTNSLKNIKQRLHPTSESKNTKSANKRDRAFVGSSSKGDKGKKAKVARTSRNVTVQRGSSSSSSQNSDNNEDSGSGSEGEEEEEGGPNSGPAEGEGEDGEEEEEEEEENERRGQKKQQSESESESEDDSEGVEEEEQEGKPTIAWNQRKQSTPTGDDPSAVNGKKEQKESVMAGNDNGSGVPSTLQEAIFLAKSALAPSLVPTCNTGREREYNEILSNLKEAISLRQGGGMYVCGIPGTGKTLTTFLALDKLIQQSSSSSSDHNVNLDEAGSKSSLSPITNSSLSSGSSSNSDGTAATAADADTVFNMTGIAPLPAVNTYGSTGNVTDFVVVKAIGTSIDEEGLYTRMFAACYQFMSKSVKDLIKGTDAGRGVSSSTRGKNGYGGESKVTLMKRCVQDYIQRSSEGKKGSTVKARSNGSMMVLLIDEIDMAPERAIRELYELCVQNDGQTNLTFVGIANSINYPQNLQLSDAAQPAQTLFEPNKVSQLEGILKARTYGIMADAAVSVVARKVFNKNGDVRQLLSLALRAIGDAHENLLLKENEQGKAAALEAEATQGDKENAPHINVNVPMMNATSSSKAKQEPKLGGPVVAIVPTAAVIKLCNSIGMGNSRQPSLIKSLSPIGRALLVAIVVAGHHNGTPAVTIPKIYSAYCTYSEITHLPHMTKEEVRTWIENQLCSYMLVNKTDNSSHFSRKKMDPDKILYTIQVDPQNMLRVDGLETIHKPHVEKLVKRLAEEDQNKREERADRVHTMGVKC